MKHRTLPMLALLAVLAGSSMAYAAASSPRLTLILPRGVQRGGEHTLTFTGSNLGDAEEIFFYDSGFKVTKVETKGNNQVIVNVTVDPNCRLGEHVAQVRTRSGISDFRTFFVGPFTAVAEAEPNSDFAEPQKVELNSTVEGIVQSEDVDYYQVSLKKGQRLSVEVEGMRLGATLFDPYVAILDSKRFELAASDDTPLLLQDCCASVIAPEDGTYTIEVRESAYGGNGNCRYRLHLGTFPRPIAVFPAGGQLGQQVEVTFLGDPAGPIKTRVQVPSEPNDEYGIFAEDGHGMAPSPNTFRISLHPNSFEAEPNNNRNEASPVEFPTAMNGIIESDGDEDYFKFTASKGQVYEVECFARRIRSELDAVMYLYDAAGKAVASNDDSRGPDSYFRFTVPADGEYTLRIRDHLGRGGPAFVYRVEFQPIAPSLALSIPRVERYGQYRQTLFVPRGNRFGTLINATRANFSGEIVLDGSNLPEGVTMHAEPMASNLSSMPVVFEAAADAPIAGKLIDFRGRQNVPDSNISGSFFNRADFVIAAPGQSRYVGKDVHQLAIAVVDELPFHLEIETPKVPLVRNGSMNLRIIAKRKEGFDAAINVQLPFRPPGVGAASSVNIPAGKSEVIYPINANGNAQIKKWKIFALGSANVSGNAWVSSPLTDLEIAGPLVTMELQRASCEQGQPARILCKLNHAAPFDGEAEATLLGLPAKVAAKPVKFSKDTQELIFEVTTDPASPAGKHKSVFCQIAIPQNGGQIISRAGGTELQIDKPLPVAKDQPKATPKPQVAQKDAPAKPAEKPLTRLEKLRLAAQERAKAKAQGGSEEQQ